MPDPVLAATEAFGCTSSKDSENTFISVPVAFWKAATMALNASSSDGTKRFQRIMVSLAPGSAFHGDSAAQARAKSNSAGPVSMPAAVRAVPPWSKARRGNSFLGPSPPARAIFFCLVLALVLQLNLELVLTLDSFGLSP